MTDFSKTPWSQFKKADYTDDQWKKACLICDKDCMEESTSKSCCKLPVKEPDGTYNINAIKAAYGALQGARGGVDLTKAQQTSAMTQLKRLYEQAGLEIPSEMEAGLSTRSYKNSLEYQRERIQAAVNEKYPHQMDGSGYNFDVEATYPDDGVVVVKDWYRRQYFQIPYTLENGLVTLGEPEETDHDELYITKQQINARLAASRAEDKPVGIGWSPGIHKLFMNGKPARLLVPEETIIPTYKLLETKLAEDRVPLGIDHLDEKILKENKILAKLNPLDVGEVKKIATDGEHIYITDSELTNPSVQELQAKGELPAFSVVGPVQAHECERDDIDYVLDYFEDIKRFDFIEQGGCQTCKTGIEPTKLILASKLSMEVDKLTDENNGQNPTDETNTEETQTQGSDGGEGNNEGNIPTDGAQGEGEPEGTQTEGNQEGTTEGEGATDSQTEEEYPDLDPKVKKYIDKQFGEVKSLINNMAQGETQKVEAKLSELDEKDKTREINQKIETKITEGTIKPAQKGGLLQAGLAMKPEDFDKHLATYTEKVVDFDQHANLEAEAPEGSPTLDDMQKARKANRF